jgi:predicted ribosome quality control (RQC) complex YloA/Tae2 family protein
MFKNFFILNRQSIEVDRLLSGFALINVFTQEKNKLIFYLRNDSKEYFIEINADSSLPYFIIREKYNRAKKNTLNFFASYLPSKLSSIKIAELDRIVQFNIQTASIYFYIHGKETNVFLIDEEKNFESFKKIEDEKNLIDEVGKLNFTNSILIPEFKLELDETSSSIISKKYPFLGREIISELIRRSDINPLQKKQVILQNILREIETTRAFVYRDDQTGKFKLSFFNRDELKSKELTFFNNLNDALKFLLVQEHKHKYENLTGRGRENKFEKNIMQLEKKRDHLQTRIKEGCKDEKYQQIANLLMMNLDMINQGASQVELENTYDSNKIITINLLPRLNLRENVNYYFDKVKSERKEFDKLNKLLSEINDQIKKQKTLFTEMKNTDIVTDDSLSSNAALKKNVDRNASQNVKSKFRQFILYDKYSIFVGKNSKNNDELTTSFAKQNDYWFHARSVSGSHVVLRWDKSYGEIQRILLEKTASLAAFYSKAKTSGLVPVSYTQKKYVIKRKGMEPGKVALFKEKVLIVRPEIPKECKLITAE